jgi:hypothetical protein
MRKVLLGMFVLLVSVNCGELHQVGNSASYLIIQSLEAAKGNDVDEFSGDLASDVVTVVNDQPTVYSDVGRAAFLLGLKDPGSPGLPTISGTNNAITVNRYRVRYIRSDGRNVEGVDVPYAFDGAFTVTVQAPIGGVFTLVRVQAKSEAPLAALANNFTTISTIAEVTFYGRDQTGREITAVGNIGVHFGNWADPSTGSGGE